MRNVILKMVPKLNLYIVWILCLGVVFFLTATKIAPVIDYHNSDFFTFWLSGRLIAQGDNPYLAGTWIQGHHQYGVTWIPNPTFIYPLPLSFIFVPLAILPLYDAFVIWMIFSQFMIVLAVALLLKSYPEHLKKILVLPLIIETAIFRPTLLTLHNGQLTALLLFVMALTVYFWEQGKWWQGCILLPILALKPNLGVPIIILISFYLLFRKQITALAVIAASGLVLLFAGLVQNPHWVVEFWGAGNTKLSQMFGYSPTVWGLSAFLCGYKRGCTVGWGALGVFILIVGYVILLGRVHHKLSPALLISFVISIVLLITPYTWSYDQLLLLLPVVIITMGLAARGYRFLPVALLFLMIDILAFVLLGIVTMVEKDLWYVILPISILTLLVWYLLTGKPADQAVVVEQFRQLSEISDQSREL
jgi:hypothetical protein